MLKKALLHPPFPRRAKTHPRLGFVLASLGGSTYKHEYASPPYSLQPCSEGARPSLARLGWAGAVVGLFEHLQAIWDTGIISWRYCIWTRGDSTAFLRVSDETGTELYR
jgi:hypothetical protein